MTDDDFAARAAQFRQPPPTGGTAPFAPFAQTGAPDWQSRGERAQGTLREVALLADPEHTGNTHVSVALARIPEGSAAPWHFHEDHEEFVYVLDGEGEFWCEGELVAHVEPGSVNVIPPHVWHTHRATRGALLFLWGYAPPGAQLSR